jgi:hypothetical protein
LPRRGIGAIVIPAKAGIQEARDSAPAALDPGFRRGDDY